MLLLECPNCGLRSVSEFRFGNIYNPRPAGSDDAEWVNYLYMRPNRLGVQTEVWYHVSGCGIWFLADRHTGTNQVLRTRLWPRGGHGAGEPTRPKNPPAEV